MNPAQTYERIVSLLRKVHSTAQHHGWRKAKLAKRSRPALRSHPSHPPQFPSPVTERSDFKLYALYSSPLYYIPADILPPYYNASVGPNVQHGYTTDGSRLHYASASPSPTLGCDSHPTRWFPSLHRVLPCVRSTKPTESHTIGRGHCRKLDVPILGPNGCRNH